jgi:3-oxoacyl-[acyl-carrier protein] reductase
LTEGHNRVEENDTNNALNGKIALVTAGSRGIGKAAALALAKAGADVAVNFQRREAEAQAVCKEIVSMGHRAVAVSADVSRAVEVTRLAETVQNGFVNTNGAGGCWLRSRRWC